MAVGVLAQGRGILWGHPDRGALLRQCRVVDDQHRLVTTDKPVRLNEQFRFQWCRIPDADATHRLICSDDRRHRPARHDADELLIEAVQTGRGIGDRIDGILEDDLLGRMRELLPGQPMCVGPAPMLAAGEDPAHDAAERNEAADASCADRPMRPHAPGPDHAPLRGSRPAPKPPSIPGAQQPRQRYRVASIGLHPFAWLTTARQPCSRGPEPRIRRYNP